MHSWRHGSLPSHGAPWCFECQMSKLKYQMKVRYARPFRTTSSNQAVLRCSHGKGGNRPGCSIDVRYWILACAGMTDIEWLLFFRQSWRKTRRGLEIWDKYDFDPDFDLDWCGVGFIDHRMVGRGRVFYRIGGLDWGHKANRGAESSAPLWFASGGWRAAMGTRCS